MPAKPPPPASIAAALTVPSCCSASGNDWQAASITHATAQHMLVRGLIERDHTATRFALTDQGRAVLGALLATR